MSEEMDPGLNTKTFLDPIRCAIKWTSMEAMMENKFSEASDVWSIGIVFWEILMRGAMPYPGVNNVDMLYFLIGGDRIHQPVNCPEPMWDVMLKCWEETPGNRWTFTQLEKAIETLQVHFESGEFRDLGIFIHSSKGEKDEEDVVQEADSSGKKGKKKEFGIDGQSIYVYDEAWKPKQQAIDAANAAAESAATDAYDVAIGAPAPTPVAPPAAATKMEPDAYDVALAPAVSPIVVAATAVSVTIPEADTYDVALVPASGANAVPESEAVGVESASQLEVAAPELKPELESKAERATFSPPSYPDSDVAAPLLKAVSVVSAAPDVAEDGFADSDQPVEDPSSPVVAEVSTTTVPTPLEEAESVPSAEDDADSAGAVSTPPDAPQGIPPAAHRNSVLEADPISDHDDGNNDNDPQPVPVVKPTRVPPPGTTPAMKRSASIRSTYGFGQLQIFHSSYAFSDTAII
jgi:hypothetical protein